jgi:HPt (histidine-containing phosphotransfer) domain-containing protein
MIDLIYLKEVSMGDAGFEQEMATKFIAIISDDLAALKQALLAHNYPQLKRVAHQMLTTMSVMGLGTKISANLRAIEFDDLSEEQLKQQVQLVTAICTKAKEEALVYLNP